jgi:NAD(P)-dependent dehydrogenase (short-subunit alcohol dehydrogenase family)
MKSIVITGVSTGIGWGAAKVAIERSFLVFGSVRKPTDAARLAAEFGPDFIPIT